MSSQQVEPASEHLHAHLDGDAQHSHVIEGRSQLALSVALGLTLLFALIEVITGFMSNSLALISDAGHMVTDAAALALALMAQAIAKRPPSSRHSFGFVRAEALAAFVNSLAMLALVAWIAWEAVQRLLHPEPVQGGVVLVVAAIGASINLLVAWVLSRDNQSINTRAALVNVMGDLLGSLAAIASGAIIYVTDWVRVDPILSIFVALLILRSTSGILRESYHFLMEGVPHEIDYLAVGADLKAVQGVLDVHDLHVWDMSPGHPALIGHLEIASLEQWPAVLAAVRAMLREKHGIDHVTLQPEAAGGKSL
ncbi:cation diffusion facilitator family transporter [Massilia sp. IC2-477]|uniref:cation diffusion facilitator family transporter n=1 Tax=unclassified Massilia TaxID=2609279 RepID=UPI001D0FCCCA|nr:MULTISPECIES: cation diffusion facilitator family transporter [unclassified Massilia]MCC2958673.1 cation diffusion facilitator family transporter [Massilia sp. IC2-477]MCC2974027.1 cation diffusion facilitator family transporter [Massilia sp. IC2-476]